MADPDPVKSKLPEGASVDLTTLDERNSAGDVQDWDGCCVIVGNVSADLTKKVNYQLSMRGKQEKKRGGGTRVAYKNTTADGKTETLRISFANEATSVKANEMTPNRFLTVTASSQSKEWSKRGTMGPIASASGWKAMLDWDKESSTDFFEKLASVKEWVDKDDQLMVLSGENGYYEPDGTGSWNRIPGNEMWSAVIADEKARRDLLKSKAGFQDAIYCYASSPNGVPLGAEFVPGVLELGVFKSLVTDMDNRINGSIKGGTIDEQRKAQSTFTQSFVRRSAQRGHHPNWNWVRAMVNIWGEGIINSRAETAGAPADVVNVANDLIKAAVARSGVRNAPILL
ncbi:MAG: S protein [Luposicya lupus actinovirus]|nr:MAG: S protein [Luposicya lupus actinovirus]